MRREADRKEKEQEREECRCTSRRRKEEQKMKEQERKECQCAARRREADRADGPSSSKSKWKPKWRCWISRIWGHEVKLLQEHLDAWAPTIFLLILLVSALASHPYPDLALVILIILAFPFALYLSLQQSQYIWLDPFSDEAYPCSVQSVD
ncbi:uncharacterized protein EDB93DRAFT_1249773 [Suillus bovinus]|uniref:uncharacterized protein n=1 Tax=Suillus bovinus TaxID=48563 RepID=UPI001B86F927|nr:uncharacterized protein EDB93DRAFT_1249773 [Suillus bovinus]KAG2150200.1 hypothetical protein EDB93DRAFT_1249773 [Suillus bovinus]